MNQIKVLAIFGTRPETIKMAPIIRELNRRPSFALKVIVTGQHKEMVQHYLDLFSIVPDHDLSIMEKEQTLNTIVINILKRLPAFLNEIQPDVVLVQGDTTSAFAAALAAYHNRIKIGHVEAGLRTRDKYNPFPEEINRHLIGGLADFHFAPTQKARENLIAEGISDKQIYVTGNTIIDALKMIVGKKHRFNDGILSKIDFEAMRVIIVTTHRRESFGKPLLNTLNALKRITELFRNTEIVIPVHYNPNVRKSVYGLLRNVERIHLVEPLDYVAFIHLLNKSYLILTDSGGVQEEAPSLGKPVLVLRETTERPEGIKAGVAKMVGTDTERIVAAVRELMEDLESYRKMAQVANPYGNGKAAARIADVLQSKGKSM
ncbi:MAG: UDP-N-acetylglucosamine 2-epimerase (non-hydrolyzing) [Nitrospirota bacterium]